MLRMTISNETVRNDVIKSNMIIGKTKTVYINK